MIVNSTQHTGLGKKQTFELFVSSKQPSEQAQPRQLTKGVSTLLDGPTRFDICVRSVLVQDKLCLIAALCIESQRSNKRYSKFNGG